ncbi:MAG TPA: efflux RND transporter periplasmic adaptor subunit [Gemmataceae bacterium]|nr:efflux RND transporter periplasmic adaptor subunit [Gemmataceae bacterium]
MPDNTRPPGHDPDKTPRDEGGLRAPPGLSFWRKAWWWFDFVVLVNLARLRFIGLLVLIGIVIVKWDTFVAYYERWARPADHEQSAGADFEYFCPMHPSVIRDNPKEKCPICFMPLSKRKKGDDKEVALPPGIVNRVQLSPYRVVLAGIQTWKVAYLPLAKEITTVGFVEFNERAVKQVAARVKGRLDELFVNETGQMVHEGHVLASLYSPDLVVTVQNLLDAQRAQSLNVVRGARERLRLWGISDDQVEEILKTGKANTHLNIRSPIDGHVLKKYVKEGQYVEEGSPLYDVVDLATVWIEAQVYEDDMAFLPADIVSHEPGGAPRETFTATATTQANPAEKFTGKLTFVYPHVDQDTRTLLVRFELPNPGHKLRPGTTATVKLKVWPRHLEMFSHALAENWAQGNALELLAGGSGRPLGAASLVYTAGSYAALYAGRLPAVPQSAVIDTGTLKLVYREIAPGEFEGVTVELGPRMVGADDVEYYPVLRGLAAGDRIVTAGSFLLDAETRLNPAAGSIYFGGSSGAAGAGSSMSNVRPSTPKDAEDKVKTSLAGLSSEEDRRLAETQKFCPVLKGSRLGLMGTPVRIVVEEQPVFLCCDSCREKAFADPKETLVKVEKLTRANMGPSPK